MMSPKTTCKGARNLCREMTHENSGWAGHSATADADEESEVAGYSAAAIVDERRVASSTSNCPVTKLWNRTRRLKFFFVPLCRACIVGRGREVPQPSSPCLKDRTSGEHNTHTIVPSDSNTMSSLGLASILTE